jgi:hypothetical protein
VRFANNLPTSIGGLRLATEVSVVSAKQTAFYAVSIVASASSAPEAAWAAPVVTSGFGGGTIPEPPSLAAFTCGSP